MPVYGPTTACQVCGSADLQSVLFLGYLPPVNVMRSIGAPHDSEPWFPAEVLTCPACHLVQLGYVADPAVIFPPEYPYTSGTTRILRENFADLARESSALLGLKTTDAVIDIGSNDGTLLKNYKDLGHPVLGVEPSLAAKLAEEKGIDTMMTFFGPETANRIVQDKKQAKVVTAANVFAHILNPNDLVEQILRILQDDGVFISESHYLGGLLETVQYDTIYHEHLRYYSLFSIKYLLEKHGLRVFHVTKIPTHGGSIRVYATKNDQYKTDDTVAAMLTEEEKNGLLSDAWIQPFVQKVLRSKLELYRLLADMKAKNQLVYGISAPSRASTLVNYVGLDDGILTCVLEITGSKKIGKYMPGRNIPVLDEAKLYQDQPPYALLLSWHIADELMPNLKKRGYKGDFIVPLPEPKIIRNADIAVPA